MNLQTASYIRFVILVHTRCLGGWELGADSSFVSGFPVYSIDGRKIWECFGCLGAGKEFIITVYARESDWEWLFRCFGGWERGYLQSAGLMSNEVLRECNLECFLTFRGLGMTLLREWLLCPL